MDVVSFIHGCGCFRDVALGLGHWSLCLVPDNTTGNHYVTCAEHSSQTSWLDFASPTFAA